MTSMEFDIDSSAGLMPKIQALIAPPESDETAKPNKKKEGLDLHPYYKRPGKGHNRDCCDACSEGGNLICCDKCPASFHLACHDPPLDDEDIPLGQWLCHKCRMTAGLPPLKEILKAKKEGSSTETSDAPVKDESLAETSTRGRGRSRASSSASLESNKSRGRGRVSAVAAATATQQSVSTTTTSVAAGPDKQSALETLIAAASSMNPTQFDLPREMVLPINFPGTDRGDNIAPTRGKKGSASKRSRTLELDNGLVPLPAKTCFECRKSCKRAPLLACDYCPLLFHLDCLDPPLTSLPCGRWMCPNHVEQAIDEKLLTSLSVTQRVALWDKYTGPIDQDAVKTEFLQKARRQNPPFRFKVKLAPRNKAKVPNSVKEMYKNRPPLIPSLRDVLRDNDFAGHWTDFVSNRFEFKTQEITEDQENKPNGPTETEQEEWLSGIVALQTSIACHLSSKKRKLSETNANLEISATEIKSEPEIDGECNENKMTKERLNQCVNSRGDSIKSDPNPDQHMNGLLHNHEQSSLDDNNTRQCISADGLNGAVSKSSFHPFKIQNGDFDPLTEIDIELSQGVEKSGGKLSQTQRVEDFKELQRLSSDKTQLEGLSNLLEKSLDCPVPDNHINKLDERLIHLLALQRLQQLTPSTKPSSYSNMCMKSQSSLIPRQPVFWPSPESGLKPRALLTPLNGSQPPMPIYYRVMEIGTGGDMDICLSYYGHCNFVTAKHAVIICDEVNRHYELMNYSEHGTTVDNVLYSCDFSDKALVKEQPLSPSSITQHHGRRSAGSSSSGANAAEPSEPEVEVPPLIQKIRAVVDKRRGVVREEDSTPEPSKMPVDIGKVDTKCSCRASSSSLIGGSGAGWEGTALLNHGSFIKFGCIQFTFSVLNFVSPSLKETSTQDSKGIISGAEGKGSIPHRIMKRERDSTSSSTLTVSPSPPPDKAGTTLRVSRNSMVLEENDGEDDDEDEEEDKNELNDESDPEDNEDNDENMEDIGEEVISEDIEMQDSMSEVKEEPESNLLGGVDNSSSLST